MDPTRRNILLGTGGALGAVALAAPAAAGVAQASVALLSTYVAGTAYHDAGAAATLRPGDPLMLRREPRNDYDRRAIEVRTRSGLKLGYVPRTDNHALANLMDAGFDVSARVQKILPDRRQPEIRLDVFISV
jgi:hypothetical protein